MDRDTGIAPEPGEPALRDEPHALISAHDHESETQRINENAYTPRQRLLHWVVAALVALQLLVGLTIGNTLDIPGPHPGLARLFAIHGGTGTLIFVLMAWRWSLRQARGVPPPPPGTPEDTTLLAHANHRAFYVVLLIMPVIGWFAVGAAGHNLSFFGIFAIPAPIGADPDAARFFGRLHAATAVVLVAAIAAHLASVVYHTYVRRDSLLRRMLP